MSNRVAVVLSIVAGFVLTAACIAFAAYEFYAPQWQIAIKGEHKGWDFGKVAAIRSNVRGMPPFSELKGQYKESQFLKYEDLKVVGTSSHKAGTGGQGQFLLLRSFDKSSPKLAELCAQGGSLGDITVRSSAQDDKHKANSMLYTLHDVTIASITLRGPQTSGGMATGAGSTGQPTEEIALNYSRVEWSWGMPQPSSLEVFPK